MRYKEIGELAEEKFRRLTEVKKKATFERTVKILDEEDKRRRGRSEEKVDFA